MQKRKLALFDIDKTIYDGYIIFSLADYQFKRKIIDKNCLESLYKDLYLYKDKKIDYETTVENLNLHWAIGLKDLSYKLILDIAKNFFTLEEENNFFPFVKDLISLFKSTHDIYFITGELQFIARAASELFSVTSFISSELEVKDGVVTGKINKSLAKRQEKKMAISYLLNKHDSKNSFAFGDSEGDIEMLNSVEFPICINPTEELKEIAKAKKWYIVNTENILDIVKNKIQN